jgi:hypothetical protein
MMKPECNAAVDDVLAIYGRLVDVKATLSVLKREDETVGLNQRDITEMVAYHVVVKELESLLWPRLDSLLECSERR